MSDSRAAWERNRYGWFEDPVTKLEQWRDLLGEYPERGRYDAVFAVGIPVTTGSFRQRVLKYRPIGWDIIEHVRQLWYRRETEAPKSVEQHVKDRYREQAAKEKAAQDELGERIRSDLWPHKHRFLEFGASALVAPNRKARRNLERILNAKRKNAKAAARAAKTAIGG